MPRAETGSHWVADVSDMTGRYPPPPYMGGVGIQRRTKELTKRLFWRTIVTVGFAWSGIGLMWFAIWKHIDVSAWVLLACVPTYIGITLFLTAWWAMARSELLIHTTLLEDENRRRGRGWAKD